MRHILLAAFVIFAPLTLSACVHSHRDDGNRNWKRDALAQCDKETDPLRRQTCLDEIAAVEHERDKVP